MSLHEKDCMNKTQVTSEWLYVFPEGNMWIVACKHYDVVTQGETRQEALDRFFKTMTVEVLMRASMAANGEKVELLPPAPPPELVASWAQRHAAAHAASNSPTNVS